MPHATSFKNSTTKVICQNQFKFNLCTLSWPYFCRMFMRWNKLLMRWWLWRFFQFYLICHCLSQKLVLMALEKSGTHKEIKVYVKSQFFLCNHYKFSEFRVDVHTLPTSDEPKLEFSGSSRAELARFRAKPSRAGALLFSSWNQAEPKFFLTHFSLSFY